jgi:hypothetical protein
MKEVTFQSKQWRQDCHRQSQISKLTPVSQTQEDENEELCRQKYDEDCENGLYSWV